MKLTPRARAGAILAAVMLAVIATFVLAAVHEHGDATRRLDAANAAYVQQKWRPATENAHAAALRALPRSHVQRESFLLLERTARSAGASDPPSALFAWTSMRQAAVATRSVVSDTSEWEREADDAIRASSGGSVEAVARAEGPPSYGFRALVGALVIAAAVAVAWLTRKSPEPVAEE